VAGMVPLIISTRCTSGRKIPSCAGWRRSLVRIVNRRQVQRMPVPARPIKIRQKYDGQENACNANLTYPIGLQATLQRFQKLKI
jgi:hypothetical protein